MTIVPGVPPTPPNPDDPEFVSYYDDGGTSRVGTKAAVDPGGGSAGSPIVRKFPFAYNTPDLLTGAAVYTPTVGDILMDAWIEIDTAWDGTTPLGDIGEFDPGGSGGLFSSIASAVDMTIADFANNLANPGVLLSSSIRTLTAAYALATARDGLRTTPGDNPQGLTGIGNPTFLDAEGGLLPARFTTADPIKVCVSQDGTNTGTDPGSTQGQAILFLVTATPI